MDHRSDVPSAPSAHVLPLLLAFAVLLAPASAGAQTIEEKAQLCAACHGENGIPTDKSMPVIWGQHQGYTYLQLRDFKSGARKSDIMSAARAGDGARRDDGAGALFRAEALAASCASRRRRADVAARATRANVAIGCTGCHQASYQGEGTQPRLAGQTREYLQRSMLDFRNKKRGNNPGMTDLMLAISEDDIAACAEYLAGLQ